MKIKEKDLFHGAALTQLTEHESFKALNKADAKYGHYMINTDRRLLLKHTKEDAGPWSFTFQPDDLNTLSSDIASGFKTYVVLVCGQIAICLLDQTDFASLLDLTNSSTQWIRVEIPKARMRVRGSNGALNHAIAHKDFPDNLFQ